MQQTQTKQCVRLLVENVTENEIAGQIISVNHCFSNSCNSNEAGGCLNEFESGSNEGEKRAERYATRVTGGFNRRKKDALDYCVPTGTRQESAGNDEFGHLNEGDRKSCAKTKVIIKGDSCRLPGDAAYLTRLLAPGSRINLVNCLDLGGDLFPELIIFEPDFLVDISLVASLFTDFGAKPLYSLIKRLMPQLPTKHNILGNFASQLLDETVHGLNRPYRDSLRDFCREHCLEMAACDTLGSDFHRQARLQKENIRRALSGKGPGALRFEPENAVIEPSFVCEMLGLQGRMDLMQNDMRVVVEQKSGKAGFVPGLAPDAPPVATTAHFVQLLLYRAALHYAFGVSDDELRSFLLYSKYAEPLVPTASAPALLWRAIAVRNTVAWQDMHLADEGFGILDTLAPDDLVAQPAAGKLWEEFVRPPLAATLETYRQAPPLEQAYCKRMMQFVEREYVRSKLGTPKKASSGVCGRWTATLEEKRDAGDIIDSLTIDTDGTRVLCHKPNSEMLNDLTGNFREGDVVTLFQYAAGAEPDCRKSIIHRAVIEGIADEEITLRLRSPQRSLASLTAAQGRLWAIEHDFIDSAFSPSLRSPFALLSATQRRRDIFLGRAVPAIDEHAVLKGDYGDFNDLQLRVKRAEELFLIVGPPGSGKTSFGMLHTLREELADAAGSVAVMSYTNRAVDEICDKLVRAKIDFLRIGSEPSCGEEFRPFMLRNRAAGISKLDELRAFIRSARVVTGTVAAFASRPELFALRSFSLAIIDEASQILEPQITGIIAAKHGDGEAIKKFVFIGDFKQLPAVVRQTSDEAAINEPVLREAGIVDCRMSLFERLLRRHESNPAVCAIMRQQGRMHQDIARVSNELFYNGLLACVPLPHQVEKSLSPRVIFVDIPAPEIKVFAKKKGKTSKVFDKDNFEEGAGSNLSLQSTSEMLHKDNPVLKPKLGNINPAEAAAVAQIIAGLDSRLSVGVIVPYRNQIAVIRRALANIGIDRSDITIDTVERFQGSQREVIIYGFTVSRREQLDFLTENTFVEDGRTIDRKLNVVITRAMKRLFLVGNARLLSTVPLFRRLIRDYCTRVELPSA